jgi:hypothetical protein
LRGRTPCCSVEFNLGCILTLPHLSDLQRQGVITKKERAATVMIVVNVANAVTVSDSCDSDCCYYFECYSLLAIVPRVGPATPFAVSTGKTVVTVSRIIMCIVDVSMNKVA